MAAEIRANLHGPKAKRGRGEPASDWSGEHVSDEGWKLNRTNYYQEGWLATGNVRGIVGVTFTTSHCKKAGDFPLRTNYNLRGHRSEVILVKWNEPYQKLASCDSSGIIFVWIKYEGRWSIELINDRNTPVTHFSWSHDGRMALICYQDGFVLVGSVAGQRYWSSMLNLESTITCGIWTPDDQQVYFGTTAGQIIVMDVHGAMVSQVQIGSEVGITSMAWSCEKFKMEEGDDADLNGTQPDEGCTFVLAVSLQNGFVFLMKSFDDVSPVQVHTGLSGPLCIEWSNSRELLAVAGSYQQPGSADYTNVLRFYSDAGVLIYSTSIPYTQSPVTALTWGHNDKRLFVATGCQVHIAWVSRRVASLQLMCRLRVHGQLRAEHQVAALPLPARIKALISNLFAQTIRCCVPETSALREFVSRPPAGSVRLHCTMIRHDDDSNLSSGTCYTLYLEYLGGLVPLLKGKRTSKIRPEFVIFDPQVDESSLGGDSNHDSGKSSGSSQNAASDTSDTEREEGCGSPRVQRRKRRRNKSHGGGGGGGGGEKAGSAAAGAAADAEQEDLTYVDTLPEHIKLVEVTSNIWGTKFKIHGLAPSVPANLGQVTYKTSLLHLQPRQMTLVITELRDDFPPGPDPNFNPNLFSEDEEEAYYHEESSRMPAGYQSDIAPPIAPMTPRSHHTPSTSGRFVQSRSRMHQALHSSKAHSHQNSITICSNATAALARAESYEDEFSYSEVTEATSSCESLKNSSVPASVSSAAKNCTDSYPCQQMISVPNGNGYNGNGTYNNSLGSGSSNGYSSGAVAQITRSNIGMASQGGQSRHVISPLVCEGAVPALQSPKNTVAPSDVLIDRTSSTHTMVASSPSDFSGNIQRVKTTIEHNQNRGNAVTNLSLTPGGAEQSCVEMKPVVVKRLDTEGSGKPHQSNNGSYSETAITLEGSFTTTSGPSYSTSPHKGTSSSSAGKRKEKSGATKSSPSGNQIGIAGNKWCVTKPEELLFIDEDGSGEPVAPERGVRRIPTSVSIAPCTAACVADSMVRSCSVGYLDMVDVNIVPCDVALSMLRKDTPKRLVLVNRKKQRKHKSKQHQSREGGDKAKDSCAGQPKLKHCGKSKSLDSSDLFPTSDTSESSSTADPPSTKRSTDRARKDTGSASASAEVSRESSSSASSPPPAAPPPRESPPVGERRAEVRASGAQAQQQHALAALESLASRIRELDETHSLPPPSPCASPRLPRSSPASPAPSKKAAKRNQSSSPIRKHLLNSPLLSRRQRKNKSIESSDDEIVHSGDEIFNGRNYRDLESFQKAQLRQKLKRGKGIDGSPTPQSPRRREFVMHNKAPMWNESSQVYQLDFGGRVTQESAKNFQIEFRGKQVMQFGRIDGNAYTLDFQYPFSALQAFAVALANVTQRLK
ncbi:tubby-related protein 4 [Schistocerca nitens]|uniref:tubby-related protein 4 n=1 Tax=Schistocerca nitens TaxID=7011 RepID=UPI0021198EB0|nr:tubby-related protein 4 [Schistocerca nitens]